MLFQDIGDQSSNIVIGIVVGALILLVILCFFTSRYRKFKTNEFVIHLRNGKVKSAGLGGKVVFVH